MGVCCRKEKPLRRSIVVCGDKTCGKTTLLSILTRGYFPQVYEAAVFDNYVHEMTVDERTVELTLWDIADKPMLETTPDMEPQVDLEGYEPTAWLPPAEAHVLAICYAVDSRDSLENAKTKWFVEMVKRFPQSKVVLLALKCDQREKEQDPNLCVKYEEARTFLR